MACLYVAKAKRDRTLRLNGAWETSGQVANAIGELVRFNLPEDYYVTYPTKVLSLQLPDVTAAASTVVQPSRETWVIVGDRSRIESGLRELGFSEIRWIDTDGRVIK